MTTQFSPESNSFKVFTLNNYNIPINIDNNIRTAASEAPTLKANLSKYPTLSSPSLSDAIFFLGQGYLNFRVTMVQLSHILLKALKYSPLKVKIYEHDCGTRIISK